VITPRRTRLVRVPDLHAFRRAIVELVGKRVEKGSRPLFDSRPLVVTLVIVPNASAASQLHRFIHRRLDSLTAGSVEILTRDGLYDRLPHSIANPPRRLTPYERDVIVQAAAREASSALGAGTASVFHLRPGLVAEMLRFYDQLRRQGKQISRFEELLEDTLRRDAEFDRGAERMLQQTRLLAATFRAYERRVAASGASDEHALRERLIVDSSSPARRIVVTVADWIADPGGLYAVDFDLLTRIPGVETIDLVVTRDDMRALKPDPDGWRVIAEHFAEREGA